jgi:hypothetical protein
MRHPLDMATENIKPVALMECPPGPFAQKSGGVWYVGFRSEYRSKVREGFYQPDAYTIESGEYWWGGCKTHEDRCKQLVYPLPVKKAVPYSDTTKVVWDLEVIGLEKKDPLFWTKIAQFGEKRLAAGETQVTLTIENVIEGAKLLAKIAGE